MRGAGQGLEPGVRDQLVGVAAVGDRDRAVALAPDDQRRHRPQQIQAVERRDLLAVDVDHRAQRLQERLARARILERAERSSDRLDEDGLSPAERPSPAPTRSIAPRTMGWAPRETSADAPGSGRPGAAGSPRGRGRRSRPAPAARPCAGTARRRPSRPHRRASADERRRLDLERREQVADHRRVGAERVVAARRRRVAVADQVGDDHRVGLGELQRDLAPVLRRVDHPVDDHQRRARAGGPVDHLVAVELEAPGGERVGASRQSRRARTPDHIQTRHRLGTRRRDRLTGYGAGKNSVVPAIRQRLRVDPCPNAPSWASQSAVKSAPARVNIVTCPEFRVGALNSCVPEPRKAA